MLRLLKKIWRNSVVFFLATVFAFSLFTLFLNPLQPVFFLGEKLKAASSVSNSASVPSNPISKLALQLNEKEKELSVKEKSLDDRALAIERENSVWKNRLLLGILVALIALFVLMLVNFYFDSRRAKELEKLEKVQK
jgi:beta-lactamase regulating signal transducer with metallopeptidase domain